MAEVPLTGGPAQPGRGALDIVTISKADAWVDTVLPRCAAMIDAACTGTVRRHLLLLTDATSRSADTRLFRSLVDAGWHTVVCRPFVDPHPGRRLLAFDALRAGLLAEFGLREALYLDPDTDVVADLQGIQLIAPEADLLWVANPLPLEPVLRDLDRLARGTESSGDAARQAEPLVLMEPGFFYMRRDLSADFAAARERLPQANDFAPGSTYWNVVVRTLGDKAVRLPDDFNRTFWDIPAAVSRARSVHFTGQWKRLQPHLDYDRPGRRITIHAEPVALPQSASAGRPASVAVVALYRDDEASLPSAFARFEAWERSGVAIRYYLLENDSVDATARLLADFMRGRSGRVESRQLAVPIPPTSPRESYARVMTRARMRNFIVDVAMADPPQSADEWTLLVDGDVFFPDDILDRMFAARRLDSRPDSIGMLTCYTQQLLDPARIPGAGAPGGETADHYHDTFAFQDIAHRHYHPFCAFARCRRCGDRGRSQLPLIPRDRGIVDVTAAFGGLALVPTPLLRDPRIRWASYGSGIDQARMLSEHVVFCDRLRTVSGRRVVVLQDVDCVFRR